MLWRCIILVLSGFCVVACDSGLDNRSAGESAPVLGAEPQSDLRILVIGGTSGIGLETVKLALARGHSVTAMARRPERMSLAHERLDVVKGDVQDLGSVKATLADNDTVVFAVGIGPTRKPVSVFSQGIANVHEAMRDLGVRRIIAVTGIGAGNSRGHGGFIYDNITQPLFLKTNYADKDRAEALILESDTDWTIVRPGLLNDDAAETQYRVISDMQGITSGDISRADVAHFILATLESQSYLGATVLLTN